MRFTTEPHYVILKTMTTLVQKFLRDRSLAELEAEHGVKARVAGHKFSLNYDQIEAKDSDPLAQECRGLILTPVQGSIVTEAPLGDTRILARPFNRFFNLGQEAAADVDLDHPGTRFYEKMDGTLTILYFDDVVGEWHVATRGVPEADLPIDGFGEYTFRTLFEHACRETTGREFKDFVRYLDVQTTYIFELTTPMNRIVVEYKDYGITLLGARARETGVEFDPVSIAPALEVPHAPVYRFGSLQEMVDFVSTRNPQNHEGIVVCDPQYRRIKVKNAGYLALNKVRDSVLNSPRGLVELILLEKLDDALPLFPDHIVERAEKLRDAFRVLVRDFRKDYLDCWNEAEKEAPIFNEMSPALQKANRKAFALAVQARGLWMAPMMDVYQGKADDLVEWIKNKRQVDGGWPNSFLDLVLRQLEAKI